MGAKRLMERYGKNLVCIRYRHDDDNKRTLKTIELIIENKPRQPNTKKIPMNKIMNLRIKANEIELQRLVKKSRGEMESFKTNVDTTI